MPKYDTSVETDWKKNDIIREIATGHPYLVVHVYQHVSTIIVDLLDNSRPRPNLTLLPSDYPYYALDKKMEEQVSGSIVSFAYNPHMLTL